MSEFHLLIMATQVGQLPSNLQLSFERRVTLNEAALEVFWQLPLKTERPGYSPGFPTHYNEIKNFSVVAPHD